MALKKTKEDWIDTQFKETDACLNKNNSKRAYQLVGDLREQSEGHLTHKSEVLALIPGLAAYFRYSFS